MSDLRKLRRLAEDIRDTFDCTGHSNGGYWFRRTIGFNDHAYFAIQPDGTQGCLHCMAVDALGNKRKLI
jgi:hypothetical protein